MVNLQGNVTHRVNLARNLNSVTLKQCYKLANDSSPDVRNALAANPDTPDEILKHMTQVFIETAPQPDETGEIPGFSRLNFPRKYSYVWSFFHNTSYSGQMIRMLSEGISFPQLDAKIAQHRKTPLDVVLKVYEKNTQSPAVMFAVSHNVSIPQTVLKDVWADAEDIGYTGVILELAHHPNAPTELVEEVAEGRHGGNYCYTVGVNMLSQYHQPYKNWPFEWVAAHFGFEVK